MDRKLFDQACAILQKNDSGSYTIPTHDMYPFQWNWDSCLTALGLAQMDEARGWLEIETLFEHQWDDGMVPHIIFHEPHDTYFPGAEVWATGRMVPTSGITQPAVAGFALLRLYERAQDKEKAAQRLKSLLPKVAKWHDWFYRYRDPEETGLVAILHPWESGRDNSVDWDDALERVPTDNVMSFVRKDTQYASRKHRPTQSDYERYISLVQIFRSLKWNNGRIYHESPFKMVDPGFNAILIRSCFDIVTLAETLGLTDIAQKSRTHAEHGLAALEKLWDEEHQQYLCFDRTVNKHVPGKSIGGLLPVFAPIPLSRAEALAKRLSSLEERVLFMTPSHDPDDTKFDETRYWRGPIWLVMNYMISDGLQNAGMDGLARRIREDSLSLITSGGFAEYYDPFNGAACGGSTFSWTAAMIMEFLRKNP